MYQIAGGKDSDVNVLTFMPQWWPVEEDEQAELDRDELRAKVARTFAAFGSIDPMFPVEDPNGS